MNTDKNCNSTVTAGTKNTALIPQPELEQDSYDWYARHEMILRIGRQINPEIDLFGDSITHYWGGLAPEPTAFRAPKIWDQTFSQYRTLNMGFGWDRVQNVLWRITHGELDHLSPRLLILNIGTNNLTTTPNASENTPAEIVEGIGQIVRQVRTLVPQIRIIQMAVFPRGQSATDDFRPKITEINRLLSLTAAERNVHFLDIGPKLLQPDNSISPAIMDDFTHPTEAGYKIWSTALTPLLKP
jgi:lysophospholipase L1-like esterase